VRESRSRGSVRGALGNGRPYRDDSHLDCRADVWALTPTMALAGNCLSRPEPFLLQADMVQWSMVVGRSGECV